MDTPGYDGPVLPHYHGDAGAPPRPVSVETIIGIGERFRAEKHLGDFRQADFHLECLACCMKYLWACGYELRESDVTRVRLSLDHVRSEQSDRMVTCNLVQPDRLGIDWQFRVGPRAPRGYRPKYLLRGGESFNPTAIILKTDPANPVDAEQAEELRICLGDPVDADLELESVGINVLRERHCRLAVTQFYMAALLELYRRKQYDGTPEPVAEDRRSSRGPGRPPLGTRADWMPFRGVCEYKLPGTTDSSKPDVNPDIDPLASYSITPDASEVDALENYNSKSDDTEVDELAADVKDKLKVETPEKPKGKAKVTVKVKSEGDK